jgi:hypothetical protein
MRDTIELARDAGVSLREYYDVTGSTLDVLRRFEALVRADERAAPVQEPAAWRLSNEAFDYQITSYDEEQANTYIKNGWHLIDALYTTPPAAAQPAAQDVAAYLFTNVQSGDIESSTDPDHKQDERELWYREELVRQHDTKKAMVLNTTSLYHPITTAPKDGTAILALLRYSDIPMPVRWKAGEWVATWDGYRVSELDGPTHWMAIPEVSTAKAAKENT